MQVTISFDVSETDEEKIELLMDLIEGTKLEEFIEEETGAFIPVITN